MSYQRLDNFQTSLSTGEIESLRQKAMASLGELNVKKRLVHNHDYLNLVNHYEYILNIYNNMLTAKKLESKNPYQTCQYNPYQAKQTIVYAGDGTTTTIVDERDVYQGKEWERQFEENVLNPPTYQLPPSNLWNIQKIKNINI